MAAFYNEFDPKAAAWLRELIRRNLIAPGVVDERSITDLKGADLEGYEQVHFFAGIGGWSYALRLAGWADDRPVWTGSCPCQPFSGAGDGRGHADHRNLWPEMFRLIAQLGPDRVFGEQVAGAVGFGWLDGVCTDLEGQGYAVGAAVLGAHSVGAPHQRQRLYWVGDSHRNGEQPRVHQVPQGTEGSGTLRSPLQDGGPGGTGVWSASGHLVGRDGGRYRVEDRPGAYPLAHGVPARVGRLRGYGNAIVPQTAAAFVSAYLDITP